MISLPEAIIILDLTFGLTKRTITLKSIPRLKVQNIKRTHPGCLEHNGRLVHILFTSNPVTASVGLEITYACIYGYNVICMHMVRLVVP